MAAVDNERFLDLDDQALELVNTLEALKAETESYAAASQRLGDALDGVVGVSAHVSQLITAIDDVVKSLREIGTPQLLNEQRSLARAMTEYRDELKHFTSSIDTRSTQLSANVNNALEQQADLLIGVRTDTSDASAAIIGLSTSLPQMIDQSMSINDQHQRERSEGVVRELALLGSSLDQDRQKTSAWVEEYRTASVRTTRLLWAVVPTVVLLFILEVVTFILVIGS